MNLILETERIFLKKFTKNDFNLVFELDGNSEVMQYITLGKTKTIEQIRNCLLYTSPSPRD